MSGSCFLRTIGFRVYAASEVLQHAGRHADGALNPTKSTDSCMLTQASGIRWASLSILTRATCGTRRMAATTWAVCSLGFRLCVLVHDLTPSCEARHCESRSHPNRPHPTFCKTAAASNIYIAAPVTDAQAAADMMCSLSSQCR